MYDWYKSLEGLSSRETFRGYLAHENGEWEKTFHSLCPSFSYLDKFNEWRNWIKNNSDSYQIPLISGISGIWIHHKCDILIHSSYEII